jgi:hypothetical protein
MVFGRTGPTFDEHAKVFEGIMKVLSHPPSLHGGRVFILASRDHHSRVTQDRSAAPGLLGRLFGSRTQEVGAISGPIALSFMTGFQFYSMIFLQEAAEFDACDEVAYDHLQR